MKWTDKELGQKDCWNLWQDKLGYLEKKTGEITAR